MTVQSVGYLKNRRKIRTEISSHSKRFKSVFFFQKDISKQCSFYDTKHGLDLYSDKLDLTYLCKHGKYVIRVMNWELSHQEKKQ